MTTEREHWLSITDDPDWRRNHINDPTIPLDQTLDAITAPFPQYPKRILEIGCGYGRLTTEIAKRYPDAVVVGADINPKVLPKTSGNITYRTIGENVFDHLAGLLPNFPYTQFDAIYSVAVFQHLTTEEKIRYIRQSSTALKRRGVLRVQFIEGDRDNFLDHWCSADLLRGACYASDFSTVSVDRGLAHPQWTWITGVKC